MRKEKESESVPNTIVLKDADLDEQTRAELIAALSTHEATVFVLNQEPSEPADPIEIMVSQEVYRATDAHGPFHSPHEGWAVIREEVKEADLQLKCICAYLHDLDIDVRNDTAEPVQREAAKGIYTEAIRLISEAIQVAATARRYVYACDNKCGEFAKLPERQ